ncbi:hypothetical protein G9A89_009628 [Geosiphon pyriformis]|nr:hypothetical protein G9A89_009628 [Geosiphon pyriformis]
MLMIVTNVNRIKRALKIIGSGRFIFFEKLYQDFSSGNKVVDEIINNPIYFTPNNEDDGGRLNYYEWIPWEHLSNINEIARGGFGIIYKATLIDGLINEWSIKHRGSMEYERGKKRKGMLIKGYLFNISSIYGITQNAETLEYGIVMMFAERGDLRIYLSTNFHSASWLSKLMIVTGIVSGLDKIHSSGMVHRNLNSGNILLVESMFGCSSIIGDLGLYQPTNHQTTTETTTSTSNSETTTSSRTAAAATTTITTTTKTTTTTIAIDKKKIYGMVPYIPPKVLRGEKFTSAGDIYSFALLLWELVTGKPPFHDYSHDNILIMAILNGARPKITSPLIPPSIAEIIKKCWDPNPKDRPTLEELLDMFRGSIGEESIDEESIGEGPKTERPEIIQFKESEKYVEEMLKNNATTTTAIHTGAVYTSRPLTLQMIDFSKVTFTSPFISYEAGICIKDIMTSIVPVVNSSYGKGAIFELLDIILTLCIGTIAQCRLPAINTFHHFTQAGRLSSKGSTLGSSQKIRMDDVKILSNDIKIDMDAVIKLKDTVKSQENSSSKYTSLTPFKPNRGISVSNSKIHPSRWNTLEFYFYYAVFIICVPMMFKIAIDLSKDTHPNYRLYYNLLERGWIFGRRVDNSDAQFASFRDNYGILTIAMFGYLFLSHLYRIFIAPKQPSKLPGQHLFRAYFFLLFALVFLYVLYGNGLLKILGILTVNYSISKILRGSRFNIIVTWVFNLALLFLNDHYKGYTFTMIDERLAFLDSNNGIIKRWFITFNVCSLRMISYNMDYYWIFHESSEPSERNDRDHAPLTVKERINRSCFAEDYNYIYYLSYVLYTPLYLAGPIVTYNNFISQLRYPQRISPRSILLYGIRLLGAILCMEFMLHYIYVVAISKSRAWDGDTPAQLSMIGYFNLKLIWLKLLIIWRFFRFWAMADGIEVAENMTRCMSNNYSAQGFWRSWHRSFNLWNIRYIYIPLGGSKHATINILIVFTFVALWHDISMHLLAWSWLIWLFILPENFLAKVFSAKKWVEWPYYRNVCAAGGVFNILMMMIANLVGFSVGLDGLADLLTQIFLTIDGFLFLIISCAAIFVAVQVMFEIREEEARIAEKSMKCLSKIIFCPFYGYPVLPYVRYHMVDRPRIRVAPLHVPFERRRQTAAVFLWMISLPVTLFLFFIACTIAFTWPFIIAYLLFVLFDIAPESGGRRFEFARRASFWKWYSEYFPIKLIKQAELDPSKNYVLGYHPHGVISVGAWTNFATEANNVSDMFPGIKFHLLTLSTNFNIPLYRDYLMAQGLASVSRQSCENILHGGPGNSILIVVGGAGESLSAHPGVYDLTLKKRLGFIKLAIRNGASLCPVFSFGENDIWEQISNEKGGIIWRLQKKIQKLAGFTLPLAHGRGVFNYDVGLLPHRRPIVTVVGKPIEVQQNDNPTEEYILEVQQKYINELFDIWNTYKDVYAKNRKSVLTIIE